MKAIKENWKLVLIVAAGIIAVIFMCIFGVQGAQNKAFALEEPEYKERKEAAKARMEATDGSK